MIPWVREKFAESRLRWQNRKQQRNELIESSSLASPSISTVSADDARPYVLPTNGRRLDSIDEQQPAPTTSALHQLQNSKRRLSSEAVAIDTNTHQLGRREFSIIHHQTYSKLNAKNDSKNNGNPGLVACTNCHIFCQWFLIRVFFSLVF